MSDEVIRELTAAIILSIYRNHVDKYNTLEKLMGDYYKILNMVTPKLKIDLDKIDIKEGFKENDNNE